MESKGRGVSLKLATALEGALERHFQLMKVSEVGMLSARALKSD